MPLDDAIAGKRPSASRNVGDANTHRPVEIEYGTRNRLRVGLGQRRSDEGHAEFHWLVEAPAVVGPATEHDFIGSRKTRNRRCDASVGQHPGLHIEGVGGIAALNARVKARGRKTEVQIARTRPRRTKEKLARAARRIIRKVVAGSVLIGCRDPAAYRKIRV